MVLKLVDINLKTDVKITCENLCNEGIKMKANSDFFLTFFQIFRALPSLFHTPIFA